MEARAVPADRRAAKVVRVEASREAAVGREAVAVGGDRAEVRAVPADKRAAKVVRVEASRVAATREGLADARVDPAVVSGETAPELQLVNKGGRRKSAGPFS